MSRIWIHRVSIASASLLALLAGCASGARDVSGIVPIPDTQLDGATQVDTGMDSGFDAGEVDAGEFDAGVDAGDLDAGMTGMDAGMTGMDAGMAITCASDQANDCATASANPISVPAGSVITFGGVVDAAGDDYVRVNFTGVGNALTTYHPKVEIISNPLNEYVFQVESSCGTAASGCGGDRTVFEQSYVPAAACSAEGNCSDNVPRVTSFIIRIRRIGVPATCFQYGISVSNMP